MKLNKECFPHSCGKEMPGCKTKLHNPDEEGNGEICFWGRHVFMGYLNMPDKTEEALDAEGWLHSGDLGKHDEKGFLFITGRIKGRDKYHLEKNIFTGSKRRTFILNIPVTDLLLNFQSSSSQQEEKTSPQFLPRTP